MPGVSPQVLRWARETAGLSREEAVSELGLRDARGIEAVKRLQALEEGRVAPTRALLTKLGTRMLEVVSPLVASGDLTTTKAGRLLAVGANNVHRVLSVHH